MRSGWHVISAQRIVVTLNNMILGEKEFFLTHLYNKCLLTNKLQNENVLLLGMLVGF